MISKRLLKSILESNQQIVGKKTLQPFRRSFNSLAKHNRHSKIDLKEFLNQVYTLRGGQKNFKNVKELDNELEKNSELKAAFEPLTKNYQEIIDNLKNPSSSKMQALNWVYNKISDQDLGGLADEMYLILGEIAQEQVLLKKIEKEKLEAEALKQSANEKAAKAKQDATNAKQEAEKAKQEANDAIEKASQAKQEASSAIEKAENAKTLLRAKNEELKDKNKREQEAIDELGEKQRILESKIKNKDKEYQEMMIEVDEKLRKADKKLKQRKQQQVEAKNHLDDLIEQERKTAKLIKENESYKAQLKREREHLNSVISQGSALLQGIEIVLCEYEKSLNIRYG